MNLRRLAAVGGCLLAAGCQDAKPLPNGAVRVLGGAIVTDTVAIPAPDSADVWAAQVVACIGRGSWPSGVKWYRASLPQNAEPIAGLADYATNTIYLDPYVFTLNPQTFRFLVKHETAHISVGWKANHPVIPPLGVTDHSEPHAIFNRECETRP